jgi:recombination protein RecA
MSKATDIDLSTLMLEEMKKAKVVPDMQMLAIDATPLVVSDTLSTGLPNLDCVLAVSEKGRWGLPVGRIVSIKSKPSVGKTTLLLRIAEQAIKRGGAVHIVESERALEIEYARKICPSVDKFFITQPDTLEEAFNAIQGALEICMKARKAKSNAPFVIVVDSFSGFTPAAELAGDFGTGGKALGEHARIASMACRKLTGLISKAKAILVLSHQTKSKIGVFWGSSDTQIGGDAFNFHDSISINMYRMAAIKDDDKIICGHFGAFKIIKNKLSPPHREAKFKLINGEGFKRDFAILDLLLSRGLVVKRGAWFNFRGRTDLKWQGADNFLQFFKDSKECRKLVKEALKS